MPLDTIKNNVRASANIFHFLELHSENFIFFRHPCPPTLQKKNMGHAGVMFLLSLGHAGSGWKVVWGKMRGSEVVISKSDGSVFFSGAGRSPNMFFAYYRTSSNRDEINMLGSMALAKRLHSISPFN